MEVIKDIGNYWELKENSWSGALDTLKDIEKADKQDELMDFLEEIYSDRTPTETEVNDLLWHDREYVYESLGLNENGELPSIIDEVKANDTTWGVNREDIDNMKETGLFEQDFLNHLTEELAETENEIYYFDFSELDVYSEKVITEEQVQWLEDNL